MATSVCIATYNGERYITPMLESILAQLDAADEVIVSDDHSTDSTLEVIRSLHDSRISIYLNPGERGYVSNFENALRHAKGDYIFIADQDDVWLPGRVSQYIHRLQQPGCLAVMADAIVTDADLQTILPSQLAPRGYYRSLMGNILRFGFLGCQLAIRRDLLRYALPFPPNHRLCTHDNWLWLCALRFGQTQVIDQPLMLYRRHEGNASQGGVNEHKPWLFRIQYRLYLIWHLIRRTFSHQ